MQVIITGATGLVATELILRLLEDTKHELLLVSRNPLNLVSRYAGFDSRVRCVSNESFLNMKENKDSILIHTAFARSSNGKDIAESLRFTSGVAHWAKDNGIPRFINISSQSVYGSNYTPFVAEDGVCSPDYLYAMGKYSSELICAEIFRDSSVNLINIRLSSVCEYARFIRVFVQNAINGEPIKITAPDQIVSFIDVRDVASALTAVIGSGRTPGGEYNVGSGRVYTISHVAAIVKSVAMSCYDIPQVNIEIRDNGTCTSLGMDISRFKRDFNWNPHFTIEDMVKSLFEMLTNAKSGAYPESLKLANSL